MTQYRILEVLHGEWVVQKRRRFGLGWRTYYHPDYVSRLPFVIPSQARDFLAKLKAKDRHRPIVVYGLT